MSRLLHSMPVSHKVIWLYGALFAGLGAPPARADTLTGLINAYRAAPAGCPGHGAAPLPALAPEAVLARVQVGSGMFLESALERLGYEAERVEVFNVTGPPDAASAMDVLQQKYCDRLLSKDFSAVGTAHTGNAWQVVLARPRVFPTLPPPEQAGQELLALVNAARAGGRTCGDRTFPPAGPLAWNAMLGEAALAHSTDMSRRRYFSHKEPGGSLPADRATRAGYHWTRVGENIASGQYSVSEVAASWLESPGHCANIMNPGFTEMGAAWVVDPASRSRTPYWTQVFGASR